METFAQRLQHAMNHVGVSISQLARELEVSYQAVSKILKTGKGSFSAENTSKAASFLSVTPDWLARNEGEMTKNSPRTSQNTVNLSSVTVIFVPYLTKEEAGMYREFLSEEREPSRRDIFTVPKGMESMHAFSLTIEDDVMEPMLPKGVQVVIGAGIEHQSGDAVFISDGTNWLIRRLIVDGDSLYIDSPRTPPKPLTWKIVGPVVSVINPVVNLNERMKGRV